MRPFRRPLAACAVALVGLAAPAAPAVTAQPRLVADLAPGEASSQPENVVTHGGKVYFSTTAEDESVALHALDPATGRVRSFPQPGVGGVRELTPFGDALYFPSFAADDEAAAVTLYRFDPATGRSAPVPGLPRGAEGTYPENLTVAGGRLLFTALTPETTPGGDEVRTLVAVGPDGRATRLVPPGLPGTVGDVAAAAGAVYFTAEADDGPSTLYRITTGAPERLDVLPPAVAAHALRLAGAGDDLLIATTDLDDDGRASGLFRLAPGAARAEPVAAFRGTDLAYARVLGYTGAYLFTQTERSDDGMRVHLHHAAGTAAPERVGTLDLGRADAFVTTSLKAAGGPLLALAYLDGDGDAPTGFVAVDPATGAARTLARYTGDGYVLARSGFAVVNGTVYFAAATDATGAELFALPAAR